MLLAFQPYRSLPFTRNPSTGGPAAVTLHWGVVIRESNEWKGFAYRKIATKHGWSTLDDQATQQALSLPGLLSGTRFTHFGPTVQMPTGAICNRVVVIETKIDSVEPGPREIVTSYGKLAK